MALVTSALKASFMGLPFGGGCVEPSIVSRLRNPTRLTRAVMKGNEDWKHQRYLLSFITDSKHCTPAVVEVLPADAVVLNQKDVSALMGEAFASAWLAMQKQVDQQIHKGART